jgi:hypothetical protein
MLDIIPNDRYILQYTERSVYIIYAN